MAHYQKRERGVPRWKWSSVSCHRKATHYVINRSATKICWLCGIHRNHPYAWEDIDPSQLDSDVLTACIERLQSFMDYCAKQVDAWEQEMEEAGQRLTVLTLLNAGLDTREVSSIIHEMEVEKDERSDADDL